MSSTFHQFLLFCKGNEVEVVQANKQPFLVATGFVEVRYYDQEFGPIKFTCRRKDEFSRKAYMDSKGYVEIQKEMAKLLKVTTIMLVRSISSLIIKMKLQQTVEMIKENHLQNTCGAEIILKGDEYEEDEEIQMEDLEQAPPKFEDTQPQVHDPMEEVNLDSMEQPRITYISYLLPSDLKEWVIAIP